MIRIFIVEDDEIIANEVAKSLNSWGFEAVIARAFDQIDEEFAVSMAQLVIIDISLPYYNGYYWCERIRRSYAELATAHQAGLVPFFLEGVALQPGLMQADGLHPTAAAQPRLLDNVWPALAPLL